MTDSRAVRAVVRAGWFYCGCCGSAEDWIETPTHVGCATCGAVLPDNQLDAYYGLV